MLEINWSKLNEVLKAFYRTTGARVAIFDDKRNEIASYPERICKLCELLRENPHIDARCKNSDKKAFDICKRNKALYTYECDMGLFESVAPVFANEKIVAYIMMGQVACLSSKSEILSHARKYFRDISKIEKAISSVTNISTERLESSSLLMNICVEYLFSTASIVVEQQDKYKKIDDYILQNIKDKIAAEDVCGHFEFSRTTLHTLLKNKYNMSFSERINFLRVEKAKELLLKKTPIESICDKIGIAEKSYFFKLFKKTTGTTTREFLFNNIKKADHNNN